MSKYQPLSEHFAGHTGPEWRASFSEVERVLGFALPKSARAGAEWWSNQADRPHVRAWTGEGWQVAEVDMAAEQVVFRKPVSEAALQDPLIGDQDIGPEVSPQPDASRQVQPVRMKLASEAASLRMRAKGWGLTAGVAAGAALVAAVGTLLVRNLSRRGPTGNS